MQTILSARHATRQIDGNLLENFRAILDQEYAQHLPLGINVESVSINREEIDASIDLFHALQEVMSKTKSKRINGRMMERHCRGALWQPAGG